MATFLYTDGVEENVPRCAASQKGLDSAVPPLTSVHGCLKSTATKLPIAVGSAELKAQCNMHMCAYVYIL